MFLFDLSCLGNVVLLSGVWAEGLSSQSVLLLCFTTRSQNLEPIIRFVAAGQWASAVVAP